MKAILDVQVLQWTGKNHREVSLFISDLEGISLSGPHPEIGDKMESRLSLIIACGDEEDSEELKQGDWLVKMLDKHLMVLTDAERKAKVLFI